MGTTKQTTNDTPISESHIAIVASEHSVSESELSEAIERIYGNLFEGADAIHQHYQSEDNPPSYLAADGIAEVIFITSQMWDRYQNDLSDDMRPAVKAVHAEFARDIGASTEIPASRDPFLMPSSVVGELVRAGLSPRQAEVQVLRNAGLTQTEIGNRLGMATNTVKVHCHRIDTKVANANLLLDLVDV
ncbi:LuxR C-terminal-related transcriptional regulator [Haladaptatus sp. NG-SE-30]